MMKIKRSVQIILVVLWVLPSAATRLAQLFSRRCVEYTLGLRQLPTLAVLHPLAYMLRNARGLRLAIISNCRQTRSSSELISGSQSKCMQLCVSLHYHGVSRLRF